MSRRRRRTAFLARAAGAGLAREDLSSAEMTGRGAHRTATLVFSLLMLAIGLALIIEAVSERGSAISTRLLLGVLFLAAGVGRAYVEIRRGRGA